MNKSILFILILGISSFSYAKKVKFAVDMTGQVVNTTGVHVTGDFQTLAGYAGGDWMSNTILMIQELADTNIYSIVVDIPAFAKYEYKFLNGDQFYETEFVPEESRVGYNFNDNRWLYVDSLANDTTFVGAIRFSQNSPEGTFLLRFKVNMSNETVSSNEIHLGADFLGWNTTNFTLYSFGNNIYEYIAYIDSNDTNCDFKFINGNSTSNYETVPSSCATNGNRTVDFTTHKVLDLVCFSECSDCQSSASLNVISKEENISIYPNPTTDFAQIIFHDDLLIHTVTLTDLLGKKVKSYTNHSGSSLQLNKDDLQEGIYIVSILNSQNNLVSTIRLIIN